MRLWQVGASPNEPNFLVHEKTCLNALHVLILASIILISIYLAGVKDVFETKSQTGLCAVGDELQPKEPSWRSDTPIESETTDWQGSSVQKFYPTQKLLLDIALQQDEFRELLRPLDPSVDWHAEETYGTEWHSAEEDIRFSHDNISPQFRRGHQGIPLEALIEQLVSEPWKSNRIPALVAVRLEASDRLVVIMGNRRLHCYKETLKRGVTCWFRVIVHEYPRFPSIEDTAMRSVLVLKVIQAWSSDKNGEDVEVLRRRKCEWRPR